MHREDFPMLKQDIVYFDNGATTLKPYCVIDAMTDYYSNYTSNVHRGDYDAAIKSNKAYDNVRDIVKDFIKATSNKEIVFTKGSTESLNMVVFGFMKYNLKVGDEVLISKAEHASNVLPWLVLAKEIGIVVKYIPLNKDYEIEVANVLKAITPHTKVISIAHISNVVGDVRDIESIGQIALQNNIYFVVDGAQSVGHINVDVKKANISFLAFSAHKALGPTGVGVLYGKYELLDIMRPLEYGGGMNQEFTSAGLYELKTAPLKLEAGTPPIAEVIGMGEALKYLANIGVDKIHEHEVALKKYLVENLEKIDNIIIYNKNSNSGILAINIKGVFAQDTSIYLNHYHIYVRSGNHCTKLLKEDLKIKNTTRISMHLYNSFSDVDKLIKVLKQSKDIFKIVI